MNVSSDQSISVRQYLDRIQFHAALAAPEAGQQQQQQQAPLPHPTLDNLVRICQQHSYNIPFENLLFVHHAVKGKERLVDPVSLHKRLVLRKRGGMCQENNALLLHNLKLLGYNAYAGLAGMVKDGRTSFPHSLVTTGVPDNPQDMYGSHHIVFVDFENGQTYLCDVGSPKHVTEPILLRAFDDTTPSTPSQQQLQKQQQEQQQQQQQLPAEWLASIGEYEQCGIRFRIRRGTLDRPEPQQPTAAATAGARPAGAAAEAAVAGAGAGMQLAKQEPVAGYYLQHCVKGVWTDMYWFQHTPPGRITPAILTTCSDQSFKSHPLFRNEMVVAKPVPGGRLYMQGFVLKTRRAGRPTEQRELQGEEERDTVLRDVFGLDLTPPVIPC